ncbi:NAD/FAD-utilizing enzyme [Moritella marina]|uniref:NAD/FAD-utilizing enzyme n=1 Tax=Moritella marina TaxID=90736 RepID=UPI003703D396
MLRHYYIADDLNELVMVEKELEEEGFTEPQIHVLSLDNVSISEYKLNNVEPVFKQNVLQGLGLGAVIGGFIALITLIVPYFSGWHTAAIGWEIFILIALCSFIFCTGEGGFLGFKKPNTRFARFQTLLKKGKHILFVDVDPVQEHNFRVIMKTHPRVKSAGCGAAVPHWLVSCQDAFQSVRKRVF